MGFLGNLVSEFTHSGQQGQQQQGSSQGTNQPPPVSPPWYAEWDARDGQWLFVNQQTGERTFNYPGPGYAQQQGGYGNNQGAYNQNAYNPTQGGYQQEEEKQGGGNGWKYAAAGAVGLAGGALMMHEGEEMSTFPETQSALKALTCDTNISTQRKAGTVTKTSLKTTLPIFPRTPQAGRASKSGASKGSTTASKTTSTTLSMMSRISPRMRPIGLARRSRK